MSTCQCRGIEQQFSPRFVAFEMWRYRRKGPSKPTRLLLDMIREIGVEAKTLLDIGGGVGAIQHELAADGLRAIYNVEGATTFLDAVRKEAERRRYADRVTYLHGDFVDLADDVPAADVVTLDKVICCYDDLDLLVARSTEKAREVYALVYPREEWWMKANLAFVNLTTRIRRIPFRSFLYPEADVDAAVRAAGLEPRHRARTFMWNIVLFTRAPESP